MGKMVWFFTTSFPDGRGWKLRRTLWRRAYESFSVWEPGESWMSMVVSLCDAYLRAYCIYDMYIYNICICMYIYIIYIVMYVYSDVKRLHTHRSFYTEEYLKLLHTQTPLHTESFTQRSLYTEELLHTSFYTEKPLHSGAFTHRRVYMQKVLHAEAFTHRSFYTEKLLQREPLPQCDIA